ncbi:hypothetical protein PVAP13_3NG307200 [Panicum virgatum]|uniref:Uncharacterized protein n=1 Tax=Panicum virgatum TaxID=38727 RepID=A0A8T0UHH2_PANVG|nr:hypothetical protein PVAP13_3NG307200 [Panicum virgatum]
MFAEPPPAKRQKTAPSGEAPMPRSRMLRQTLFVVMFLVRMSVRIASFTKIRRLLSSIAPFPVQKPVPLTSLTSLINCRP